MIDELNELNAEGGNAAEIFSRAFAHQGQQDFNLQDDQTKAQDDKVQKIFLKAFSITGEAKIKPILDFISPLIGSSQKFLIFAHHKVVMDALDSYLSTKEV